MSKLDSLQPDEQGYYDVQLTVNGEWVVKALLTKREVLKVGDYIDEVMEDD